MQQILPLTLREILTVTKVEPYLRALLAEQIANKVLAPFSALEDLLSFCTKPGPRIRANLVTSCFKVFRCKPIVHIIILGKRVVPQSHIAQVYWRPKVAVGHVKSALPG